jgi:tetratricopeptide (TPR) repeat protein
MNIRLRIATLFAAAFLAPAYSFAQILPTNPAGGLNLYSGWVVGGKVMTLQGDPVSGARVEIVVTSVSGGVRSLVTNAHGEFQTDYSLNLEVVKSFAIDLRVAKKGFLRAHALIDFGQSNKTWVIPVTLREPKEDPRLLPQAALISGLAPKLAKLTASDGLSAAAEKDYARGVAEFLEKKTSDRALPFLMKVAQRDVACLQCRTMLALAELESGDWDGASRNLAEVFSKLQADRTLGRPEPLVALGVMESWRHQPRNAAAYFVEALKYAPQDVLALQELGRSQLLIQNWGAAAEYLGKAVALGANPEVRLLYVEALEGAARFQEADVEMNHYLAGRDVRKMPFEVRRLWVQIDNQKQIAAAYKKGKPKGDQALDYLHRPPSDLLGLEPAADQAKLDSILSAVGKTVAESFINFPNTSSVEQIHQEKLQRKQKSGATLEQKFRYLCFTPPQTWGPGFNEYRTDLSGRQTWPQGLGDGFMLTSGFASAALVFHPQYQPQAEFRIIGRQKVNGRDSYVVAFAQQPEKAQFTGAFKSGETTVTTFSQGLAWIDSETYQITRLRTDLLQPVQEINLERETTEIAYGEVHFKGMDEGFWVPQQVTVTVDWNGKHLRNEHRYSEFKLFQVAATEKLGKPKEPAQPPSTE